MRESVIEMLEKPRHDPDPINTKSARKKKINVPLGRSISVDDLPPESEFAKAAKCTKKCLLWTLLGRWTEHFKCGISRDD